MVMTTALDIERKKHEATQLPNPTGYRILIAIPEKEEKTEGGIIKAEETIRHEEVSTRFMGKNFVSLMMIVSKRWLMIPEV